MGVMDLRRRMMADAPQLYTATGAVASFSTNMVAPLKSCVVEFAPVQEGSGDPSPTNVRPITGWTGCDVQQTGKNLLDMNLLNKGNKDMTRACCANRILPSFDFLFS